MMEASAAFAQAAARRSRQRYRSQVEVRELQRWNQERLCLQLLLRLCLQLLLRLCLQLLLRYRYQQPSHTTRACRRLWSEQVLAEYLPAAGRNCGRQTNKFEHVQVKRFCCL